MVVAKDNEIDKPECTFVVVVVVVAFVVTFVVAS